MTASRSTSCGGASALCKRARTQATSDATDDRAPRARPGRLDLLDGGSARVLAAQPARRLYAGSHGTSVGCSAEEGVIAKSSDKPKKQQKQKPQKSLKERRNEKRAAKKFGSGSGA